jgi:hypothetical protein
VRERGAMCERERQLYAIARELYEREAEMDLHE